MGSRGRAWSVFDAVRSFPSTPEALMAQIDAAIAAHEYTHATALLSASPSSSPPDHDGEAKAAAAAAGAEEEVSKEGAAAAPAVGVGGGGGGGGAFDARLADKAYMAACAALSSGRPDAAVRSLRVAIANCPPDKVSAVAKLHSLLAIASAQLQKQQNKR
ncbi:hypothetical protein ACMD2_04891 [Ananas comosus]|uniref:Uncharacterized protein n=1 Tax=Ananas comosus TaxID=4615 RepID=A0A199UMY5_ANACO|nr:hypothetical protein ACMD2_04891 [Ananas comosus]